MLKVSKKVKICIIVLCVIFIVGLSIFATKYITANSYNIKEITYISLESSSTESTEGTVSNGVSARSSVSQDIESIDKDAMPEEEYAVMRALSVLLNSPMSKSIESAGYEVKFVEDHWVTKFSCSEFDLFVSCDEEYFYPLMFTCSRQFTPEEKEFFLSLGTAWEVENEDGTYSIYYT